MLNIENPLPAAPVSSLPHPILSQILKSSIEDILQDELYPVQNSFPVDPSFFGGLDESDTAGSYLGFDPNSGGKTYVSEDAPNDDEAAKLTAAFGSAIDDADIGVITPLLSKRRWAGIRLMRKELESAQETDDEPSATREVIEKRIIELNGVKESIEAKMDSLIYVAVPNMSKVYVDVLNHSDEFGRLSCKVKQHQNQLTDACQHIRIYNGLLNLIKKRKRLGEVKNLIARCSDLRAKIESIEDILNVQSGYAKYIHSAAALLDSLAAGEKEHTSSSSSFSAPSDFRELNCVQVSLDYVRNKLQFLPEMILDSVVSTDRAAAVPITIPVHSSKMLLECTYRSLKYRLGTSSQIETAMLESLENTFINSFLRDVKLTLQPEIPDIVGQQEQRLSQDHLKNRLPARTDLPEVLNAAANCLTDPTEVFISLLDCLVSMISHYHHTLMVAKACANIAERGIGNVTVPFQTFWPEAAEKADRIPTILCNILADVIQRLPLPSVGSSISMNCRPLQLIGCGFAVLAGLIHSYLRRVMAAGNIKVKVIQKLEGVLDKLSNVLHTRCIKLFSIIREEAVMTLSDDITANEKWRPIPVREVPSYRSSKSLIKPKLNVSLCEYYARDLASAVPMRRLAKPTQPNNVNASDMATDQVANGIIQTPFRQVRRWMLKAISVAELIMGANEADEVEMLDDIGEEGLNRDEMCTGSKSTATNVTRPCIMEFELKILHTALTNYRGLALMPFLAEQVFLSLQELWNLAVYSSIIFVLPQSEIESIIIPRNTAAPEANCIGGPSIENCYALCLEQRRVRLLRQKIHNIIHIHCENINEGDQTTAMNKFPRHVAVLCKQRAQAAGIRPGTGISGNRAGICSGEPRDSRLYYDIIKRICAAEALNETSHSLLGVIENYLEGDMMQNGAAFVREMQDIVIDVKYLLNLSAAKSAYSLINNFGDAFRSSFQIIPDISALKHDDKLLVVLENFRRSVEVELRRLVVMAGGYVTEEAYGEFKERLLSVIEQDMVSVIGGINKGKNIHSRSPTDNNAPSHVEAGESTAGGTSTPSGKNLRRLRPQDLEVLKVIFMGILAQLRHSMNLKDGKAWPSHDHKKAAGSSGTRNGILSYYLDAHKVPLASIPKWYSDHVHYGIPIDAMRGLVIHMAETEADIISVNLEIQNWMSKLLRVAADDREIG